MITTLFALAIVACGAIIFAGVAGARKDVRRFELEIETRIPSENERNPAEIRSLDDSALTTVAFSSSLICAAKAQSLANSVQPEKCSEHLSSALEADQLVR
jgi:hypothetical protein